MKIFRAILAGILFAFMIWVCERGVQILWKQHQSESFSSTQGKVLSSQVTIMQGSKGSTFYHVSVSYRYGVDGQTYVGRRYRYDGHPLDKNLVNAVVAGHPAGSAVPVFYNPQNPRDSVLSTGVDVQDVSILFLTTPACLLFLWLLTNAVQDIDWGGMPVAGGVKLISEMMVTRVRLPRYQPRTLGLGALSGLSLVAGMLMGSRILSGPPLTLGGWSLPCVLLGGVMAYGWQYWKVHSGRQDLVIDEGARTIQMPLTYKRRTQTPVPFSEIQAVALEQVGRRRKGRAYYNYLVTLEMKDGSVQNLISMNQARAEALAAWLEEKLGVARVTPVLNPEA
jgi:hypothetical protein